MAGKKKKKQKSIGRVFLKYFLVLTMIFVIVFGGVVAGVFVGSANVDKDINLDKLSLSLTSVIYGEDSDGKTVEFEKLNGKENRIWVDFDKIPEEMKNAFVAIEDERFYSHNGVDIRRFTSAAINYVFKKGSQHGGSTITQQLIKNLTGDKDVKISRKLTEIIRAYTLERKVRDKDKILEAYLNTIYLGQGCNGVQLASNVYFNKDVSELNLAECAAIAGITQSPVYYDPFLNPENNKTKQETVLAKMLELGYITQQEHDDAVDASDAVRRTFEDIGVRCQRQQQQRYDHSERNVAADVARRERQGADQGADAQDDEDVEDVRPHDVADCHVAFACDGREHRHDQFGRRGADGDHRESDDEFRHAEPLRQRRGAVRQEVRACEDQSEADDEE